MDTKEKEDLKRRQNLSHEAGTFLDLPILLCLHPKLLPPVVSLYPLLGLVGSQSPFLIDQQLDLSPV